MEAKHSLDCGSQSCSVSKRILSFVSDLLTGPLKADGAIKREILSQLSPKLPSCPTNFFFFFFCPNSSAEQLCVVPFIFLIMFVFSPVLYVIGWNFGGSHLVTLARAASSSPLTLCRREVNLHLMVPKRPRDPVPRKKEVSLTENFDEGPSASVPCWTEGLTGGESPRISHWSWPPKCRSDVDVRPLLSGSRHPTDPNLPEAPGHPEPPVRLSLCKGGPGNQKPRYGPTVKQCKVGQPPRPGAPNRIWGGLRGFCSFQGASLILSIYRNTSTAGRRKRCRWTGWPGEAGLRAFLPSEEPASWQLSPLKARS